jgi:hypothetical protein
MREHPAYSFLFASFVLLPAAKNGCWRFYSNIYISVGAGIEPATYETLIRCSTIELSYFLRWESNP